MAGEVYSKLITSKNPKVMNASSRNGLKIDRIIIHHNATTNKNTAMNTWVQGGPANTSAHYEVTPTEIIGCVGEQYAAWHAGGTGGSDVPRIASPNQRSIGIENLNSTGGPGWKVDPKTVANCARLVADICKRYGIPLDRKHVLGHNEVTATACPGGLDVDEVVRLAKKGGTSVAKPTYYKAKGLYEVIAPQINGYRDIGFKQKRAVRFVKGTRFYAEPEKYGKITRFKTSMGYFSSNKAFVKFIKAID
ncbi:N-acetylmuramoyl-L-alanine amidase [Secundilactobacillus kimchicus JCM 15530]|uniref:N-acetylmuramoyl-L-alanine amidase n=1 Tax=Secundilactobacillus kimchicus JCM 15530 TaxID=1302272 RepID=A0A0R1HJF2_9LACO|nr:peptidoglycan recognition family protein [Secundilactobacillus kimchicus]KRK46757.1 N-acetylmuramoyl-L-alanine amidase [Secundilactobacillus kimchicus JCM 15530]